MPDLRTDAVRVLVPATCANIGPGFDTLGLALDVHDTLTAMATDDPGVLVEVAGHGADDVPRDAGNLVVRAMALGFAAMDVRPTGFVLRCDNVIPHGRGLGSSAAAIIGGLVLARAMVVDGDARMGDADLLQVALRLESHPDNLAPALLGSFTTAWLNAGVAEWVRHEVHPDVQPIIAIPDFQVPTKQARSALAPTVSRDEAVFNIGRAALLVHAMTQEPGLLLTATEDRLHQEPRRAMYPQSMDLVDRLRADGIAAAISGAGPAVLAFGGPAVLDRVRASAGERWDVRRTAIATRGAHTTPVLQP